MMLGDPIIHECPRCGKKMEGPNILSGNSFGARYFSDGNAFMPMLPKMPMITKCPDCQNFFWLGRGYSEAEDQLYESVFSEEQSDSFKNTIGWLHEDQSDEDFEKILREARANRKKEEHPEKKHITNTPKKLAKSAPEEDLTWVPPLDAQDLKQAIEQEIYENNNDRELFLRKNYWFEINNRKKTDEEMFTNPEERLFWEKNLSEILKLLDPGEMDDLCARAEIYRNLGQFDQCLDTLKKLVGEDYQLFKETLSEECQKGNRWVVELKK